MMNKLESMQSMCSVERQHSFSRSELKEIIVNHSRDHEGIFDTEHISYKPRAAVFILNTDKY